MVFRHCNFVGLFDDGPNKELSFTINDIVDNGPTMLDMKARKLHPFLRMGRHVTKPPLVCSRCKFQPSVLDLDENDLIVNRSFATFRELRKHHVTYHSFEYANIHPELDQDTDEEMEWSFGVCDQCDKLCLTEESLDLHKKMVHDHKYTLEAFQYFRSAVTSNRDKVDKTIQRSLFVESILKSYEERKMLPVVPKKPEEPNSWHTEGDPEAYDLDKVLRELGEVIIDGNECYI